MALEASLSIPDGHTERLQPMRPLVVVGAVPHLYSKKESDNSSIRALNGGYVDNVHFITHALGSPDVIVGTTGTQIGEANLRRAHGEYYTGWNQAVLNSPRFFPVTRSFPTANLDELSFPKNILASIGPHLTISVEADNNLLQTIRSIDPHHKVIVDRELGEGGRYAGLETGNLTFVTLPQRLPDREAKLQELRELLPGRTIVPIPSPHEVGIINDFKRVTYHIDQYISHPLPLADGSGYIVAIDAIYQTRLQEYGVTVPEVTQDRKKIVYVPVDFRYTANYLLNTIGSPTGHIFVEPELEYVLSHESDCWNSLDHTKIQVMPSNIASDENTRGGSGCKVVILAA